MKLLNLLRALLIAILFFSVSCSNNNPTEKDELKGDFKFETITETDNKDFSIDLPETMKPVDFLNPEARLQYVDSSNNHFFILMEEDVTEVTEQMKENGKYKSGLSFMHNYGAERFSMFKENVKMIDEPVMSGLTASGKNMLYIMANGRSEGVPEDICYRLGFIDDGKKTYMLMAWGLLKNEAEFHLVAKNIFESFTLKRLPR